MSLLLHSSSLTFFVRHCRPLIFLTLFFYLLLLITPTHGQEQGPSNEPAIGVHLLERALPSHISYTDDKSNRYSEYATHNSPHPYIYNNQAAMETDETTTAPLETHTSMDSSTPTPTANTGNPASSDTPTGQVKQVETGTAAQAAPATELTDTDTSTETFVEGSTETGPTTEDTSTVTATDTALPETTIASSTTHTSIEPITSSTPASKTTLHHSDTSIEPSKTLEHSTSESAITTPTASTITSSTPPTNVNSHSILMATSETATATTSDPSFSLTLYTTRSFSITSSTAVPSLVLGKNECASDMHAINGMCPDDYFCNAALKTCVALKNNGEQCYEDFQCLSSYCGNVCTDPPSTSPNTALTGGQIAGITLGCISAAVLLVLGLIRWQKRSRQLHLRAARFREFDKEDGADGSARLSKYNFLARALHNGDTMQQETDDYDVDDSQFYASTQHMSIDSSPHFYDPGLQSTAGSGRSMPSTPLAMASVPSGAFTRNSGGTNHNPFRALDQRNYDYI